MYEINWSSGKAVVVKRVLTREETRDAVEAAFAKHFRAWN